MLNKEYIEERVKRHVGRCLQRLDEISTPEIVKDSVKSCFWTLATDLKLELDNVKEQDRNGTQSNDKTRILDI